MEGEHWWDAGPPKDLVGVDAGALKLGVDRFSVVGGEPDSDRAAADVDCGRFERHDHGVGGEFDPAPAVGCRVVSYCGEAEGVDVEAQRGVLVLDEANLAPAGARMSDVVVVGQGSLAVGVSRLPEPDLADV